MDARKEEKQKKISNNLIDFASRCQQTRIDSQKAAIKCVCMCVGNFDTFIWRNERT